MKGEDIRFLAEWEPQGHVLMSWPEPDTDWEYMLDEARECYDGIIRALTQEGVLVLLLVHDREYAESHFRLLLSPESYLNLRIEEMAYNDTWTRDYGPLSVVKGERNRCLDFGFNGWGLKFASDKDNLVNLHLAEAGLIAGSVYRNERDFILEGGSVETDGRGTLLTTSRCLCSPNRNGGKSKSELNGILHDRLGVDHVLWLDYGALEGDDTDSHIDTLARLAPHDTILFTGCRDMDDPHFEELLKMRAQLTMFRTREGDPFNLVELPLPDAVYDGEGQRIPATYANYLVTDKVIFIPSYGQPHNDLLAAQTIRVAYPERKAVSVDCRALLKQHGSLHCATMQLPAGFLDGPSMKFGCLKV